MSFSWNNTALMCLQRCGEQFRRRYIEREKTPPGIALSRGQAVHSVASEAHVRQRDAKLKLGRFRRNEALPSVEEARDLAATAFDAQLRRNGASFTRDESREGEAVVTGRAKDMAVALSGLYVGKVAPDIDPIAVEERVVVRPKDTDLEIHGTMDLVGELPSGGEVVDDEKTSGKSPNKNAAHVSQQLSFYAMLRWALKGRLPEKVRLNYLVQTPALGKLSVVTLESVRTPESVAALARRLNTAVEGVKKGVFIPTNPDNWWCSERYCEFWRDCRYAERAGQGAAEGGDV